MESSRLVAVVFAVAFAVLRLHGERGSVFQACAHLFVGVLIGAGFANGPRNGCGYLFLAVVLSAVEVFAVVRSL